MTSIKLKPDRTLINSDFNGYKLSNSSDIVKNYSKKIPNGLPLTASNDASSYLHTRVTSLFNHLVADPHSEVDEISTVYCFNARGELHAFDFSKEILLCDSRVVWQLDLTSSGVAKPPSLLLDSVIENGEVDGSDKSFGALPPSLVFADDVTAVASNGTDQMFVIHTADRNPTQHHTWLTSFSIAPGSYQVLDARVICSAADEDPSSTLHILALTTCVPSALPTAPNKHVQNLTSLHLVNWITLVNNGEGDYSVTRERLYASRSPLQYCHFDQKCEGILFLTHQHCHLLHDSLRPNLLQEITESEGSEGNPQAIFYQTDDEITLRLSTGESIPSTSLRVAITSTNITLSSSLDSQELFRANFCHNVLPETATWVIEGGTVEVSVSKSTSDQKWSELFKDTPIEVQEVMSEELLQEMKEKLRHLTSDKWEKGGLGDNPAYDPNQLEACDDADSDLLLLCVAGESDCSIPSTPRAMLGNTQYLATVPSATGQSPMFCLRHDVDGFVYRVEETFTSPSEQFTHCATFDAFGYVKASKAIAKYTSAPNDCQFVGVCDTSSRVYVFCQPLATSGRELKNRKTGRVLTKVARQLLLSVPCHDELLGMVTLSDLVLVCTREKLFAFSLNLDEA